MLALTATATDKVKADVLKLLGMKRDCRTFQARPCKWRLGLSWPAVSLATNAEVSHLACSVSGTDEYKRQRTVAYCTKHGRSFMRRR